MRMVFNPISKLVVDEKYVSNWKTGIMKSITRMRIMTVLVVLSERVLEILDSEGTSISMSSSRSVY
jgi:hypothetical protein